MYWRQLFEPSSCSRLFRLVRVLRLALRTYRNGSPASECQSPSGIADWHFNPTGICEATSWRRGVAVAHRLLIALVVATAVNSSAGVKALPDCPRSTNRIEEDPVTAACNCRTAIVPKTLEQARRPWMPVDLRHLSLLRGSWVLISRVISSVIILITHIRGLITPHITGILVSSQPWVQTSLHVSPTPPICQRVALGHPIRRPDITATTKLPEALRV